MQGPAHRGRRYPECRCGAARLYDDARAPGTRGRRLSRTDSSPAATRPTTPSSTRSRATSPTSTTARSPRSARSTTSSAMRGDVLDLMSSWVSHFRRGAGSADRARDERRRARREPAGAAWVVHDLNARPGAAVRRRLVRSRDVLRLGRLPHPARRRVPRRGPRRAPGRPVRVHVLEPPVPDQGDPGLAVLREHDAPCEIVAGYFAAAGGFAPASSRQCATPPGGDPLYAVWSKVV